MHVSAPLTTATGMAGSVMLAPVAPTPLMPNNPMVITDVASNMMVSQKRKSDQMISNSAHMSRDMSIPLSTPWADGILSSGMVKKEASKPLTDQQKIAFAIQEGQNHILIIVFLICTLQCLNSCLFFISFTNA